MIGQSKISEMLYDMIPNVMLLDVSGSLQRENKLKRYNEHLILDWKFTACIIIVYLNWMAIYFVKR